MSKPVFVVDWDGVCQEDIWPAWGEWLPGAVEGLRHLSQLGRVRIHSSRLNPYRYGHDGRHARPQSSVAKDIQEMRRRLDGAGLHAVEIHTTHGKPSGTYYIDDRAIEFHSWDQVLRRVQNA